ncbi:hypothetical protein GRI75_13760 [Altererythrobacter soli]|uniref:SH3 domain-containing protein n=1 Tax=Croceibacterium soli TaxID=1739690 RepID=A0A6I4UZP3_9SPHN|nr:hypothetical protein [Croceibacterium soli]MXP42707.1 hypothetical protein [Croceibacterium soli]
MTRRDWSLAAALPLVLLLQSCERQEAPADELVESAEQFVGTKKSEPKPLANGPYAPRDTCGDLEGADAFRQSLAEAVRLRDADALVALAAEDIKLDFGGGTGRAELRKRLTSGEWNLWQELDELLALGCAANKQGGITIPWYFEQAIPGVDPMAGMIVTGEDVPLREAPEDGGAAASALSWGVVEISNFRPEAPYQQVKTTDGSQGFIATDKLRSLIDYRLSATSRNGKWSIVSFVAGD